MNFVALDFETANHQRESVCEIGIAIVQDGVVKEQKSWLVRPRNNWFNSMNTRIHGIDAQKVAHSPEFDEIWQTVRSYFEDAYVVAHNASFDLSVLRHVLAQYELPFPHLSYACSLQVARRAWRGFPSYGLSALSERFGISLNHHAAGSDAEACAHILLKAMEAHQLTQFEDIEQAFGIQLGKLYAQGYIPSGRSSRPQKKKKLSLQNMPLDLSRVSKSHPLYGKSVVFTGSLRSMSRAEAQKSVIEAGGNSTNFVNDQTHYLVLSERVFVNLARGGHNNKVQQAQHLNAGRKPVTLISEGEFLTLLQYEVSEEP
ncbi:exonuclease domain-containing protein [Catalinimonas niigatensis]|uniref:exonuclease domain-containing protein n=1 Tax=Catalinimonas niigatensis TaxID=1397264 RepID=UPI002665F938|nr:exonuclease domain-containing protein [Catalinimonas niigatensis]WPP52928.1 exonuclease domain-containing protein [Catalinimonas niigatensis]